MIALHKFMAEPLVIRAGWTLVHFLWQGSIIAVLLAGLRAATGGWLHVRRRYVLSWLALALMSAAPVVVLDAQPVAVRRTPFVSALLFDPFFATPQQPAP